MLFFCRRWMGLTSFRLVRVWIGQLTKGPAHERFKDRLPRAVPTSHARSAVPLFAATESQCSLDAPQGERVSAVGRRSSEGIRQIEESGRRPIRRRFDHRPCNPPQTRLHSAPRAANRLRAHQIYCGRGGRGYARSGTNAPRNDAPRNGPESAMNPPAPLSERYSPMWRLARVDRYAPCSFPRRGMLAAYFATRTHSRGNEAAAPPFDLAAPSRWPCPRSIRAS
jgi:hypothetical protein